MKTKPIFFSRLLSKKPFFGSLPFHYSCSDFFHLTDPTATSICPPPAAVFYPPPLPSLVHLPPLSPPLSEQVRKSITDRSISFFLFYSPTLTPRQRSSHHRPVPRPDPGLLQKPYGGSVCLCESLIWLSSFQQGSEQMEETNIFPVFFFLRTCILWLFFLLSEFIFSVMLNHKHARSFCWPCYYLASPCDRGDF